MTEINKLSVIFKKDILEDIKVICANEKNQEVSYKEASRYLIQDPLIDFTSSCNLFNEFLVDSIPNRCKIGFEFERVQYFIEVNSFDKLSFKECENELTERITKIKNIIEKYKNSREYTVNFY